MAGTPQEQDAAEKAAHHDDTPHTMYLDTLARPFFTVQFNRAPDDDWENDFYNTYTVLDIAGNRRVVYDARGLATLAWTYNLVGAPVKQVSMDSGKSYASLTADNQPFIAWNNYLHPIGYSYDVLRRPTAKNAGYAANTFNAVLEKMEYGESATSPAASNLNGKLYKVYDGSGIQVMSSYTFAGYPNTTTRQFTVNNIFLLPNWSGSVSMETTVYSTAYTYDALGRPVTLTTPDGAVTTTTYNSSGLPFSTRVSGVHGLSTDIINEIYYDAKGQQQKVKYENGSTTLYEYDPYTFRVTRIHTVRSSDSKDLQDLL